tara:strand:- start:2024 stop:2512 length:489 start_codon:yes stop_codon:yes gene_type:complete
MLKNILDKFKNNPLLIIQLLYVITTAAMLVEHFKVDEADPESNECSLGNDVNPILAIGLVVVVLGTHVMMLFDSDQAELNMGNVYVIVGAIAVIAGVLVNLFSTGLLESEPTYSCQNLEKTESLVFGGGAIVFCLYLLYKFVFAPLLSSGSGFNFESRLSYA